MSPLVLVGNPARRRRRKSTKAASPAQRANRARFAAAARARSGSRKRRIGRARTAVVTVSANPIRRHRRRSVSRRTSRRVRRNPIGGNMLRGIVPMLKNAGVGAGGALAVDVGYGMLLPYVPAAFASPLSETGGLNPAYYAGKAALAIAVGMVGKKFLGHYAGVMVEGSLTVTLHDAMKQFAQSSGLNVPMADYMPGGLQVDQLDAARSLRGVRRYLPSVAPGSGATMGRYLNAASREAVVH